MPDLNGRQDVNYDSTRSFEDTASDSDSDDLSRPILRRPSSVHTSVTPRTPSQASIPETIYSDDDYGAQHTLKKAKTQYLSSPDRTPTKRRPKTPTPSPLRKVTRAVPHEGGHGERIVLTDDEEEDLSIEFRVAQKPKKRVAPKKRPAVKSQPVISTSKPVKPRKVAKWRFDGEKSEEDVDRGIDENAALPSYLQARKRAFQEAKKALDSYQPAAAEAVFRIPPSWDDIDFSDDERLEYLESRPNFKMPPCASYEDVYMEDSLGVIPCSIAQYLRSYQVEGAKFLHKNFVFQEGCILGDDMGLGKTVEVIAFLTAAFGKTGDERDCKRLRKMQRHNRIAGEERWYPKVLIICPASLIDNWLQELKTWGWWKVEVFHGSREYKETALSAAKAGGVEIMITNYETYRLRSEEVNQVHWDAVIADECHKIKERSSDTTHRMNAINALCRIGLTGTAIQNKYEELWTLLSWCRPGAVGTLKEWEETISHPLRIGQQHTATLGQIGRARKVASALVNNLLPRMFLRRMKTLIADQLPKKIDKVVFCPLTDLQRKAYENFLDSPRIRLIRDGNDECDCGSGKVRRKCCYQTDPEGRKINELIFPSIQWVQKLSNHLANWIPEPTDTDFDRAEKLDLLQTCLPDTYQELTSRERLLNYMDPRLCGKWSVLQKLLAFWHASGTDKVLIFSYSLNLLKILRSLFRQTSYNVCYLDGSMPLPERAQQVREFNTNPAQFVFLISTKAGGVGLNITAANKVVIFDPNWNPSFDLQAQDRAYRIGQTRDVEVFRLVSAGTIEEIVYARQIYKQQQARIGYGASEERRYFSGVMGDEKNKGELFGLRNLFALQDNAILQVIVNKTNVAERKAGVLVVGMDAEKARDEADPRELDPAGDTEKAALSQLVDLATEGDTKKRPVILPPEQSAISAILASAGVSYTHDNSEVIGSSKVEAEISRKALQAADNRQLADVAAFASQGRVKGEGEGGVRYNPPEEVRMRQFCEMARMMGFEGREGVRTWALTVEGMGVRGRGEVLEGFYRKRRRMMMEGRGRSEEGDTVEKREDEGEKERKKGKNERKQAKAEDVEEKKAVKAKKDPESTFWKDMRSETTEISDDEL